MRVNLSSERERAARSSWCERRNLTQSEESDLSERRQTRRFLFRRRVETDVAVTFVSSNRLRARERERERDGGTSDVPPRGDNANEKEKAKEKKKL